MAALRSQSSPTECADDTLGTYHQDGSVGGYWKRFDYFSSYSGFGTQNNVPNSQYHRDTYLGNFGYQLSPNTTLRHGPSHGGGIQFIQCSSCVRNSR